MAAAGASRAIRSWLERDLADTVARLCRSTVQVLGPGPRSGSGVVWGAGGVIVTNAHVASPPIRVILSDGRRLSGRLLARDRGCDLAAIELDADDLPPAIVGDSDRLRVGELVIATGHAHGLPVALTAGVIHAISRHGPTPAFIQADLRLAPGNSGGPLADARGSVVGINTMVTGGLACAVPSRVVQRFLAAVPPSVAAAR
ncbi:MAG TPA: trypsin-like peptidase domain-containing protein [Candidatus Methylomirabilis sp.]|nr:trypsin-like peptidase domain-containing protein [Candidatus Methylomirabilis sp.]